VRLDHLLSRETRKRIDLFHSSRGLYMINAGHIPAVSNSLFGFEGIIFFSRMYLDNCIEEATWKKKA
jgi:hypothetical protein